MNREVSGVMFSYVSTSKAKNAGTHVEQPSKAPNTNQGVKDTDVKKANAVCQDTIWKQAVHNEQKSVKLWENNWGFLTEFDSRGNPVERQPLPESESRFSSGPVPNTNSGHYGARVNTEQGRTMQELEFNLSKKNKKKKLGSEMICY